MVLRPTTGWKVHRHKCQGGGPAVGTLWGR